MINQQAQIIAYMDDYKLMIFTTAPALLLLLLMRRPRAQAGRTGGDARGDGLNYPRCRELSGSALFANPARVQLALTRVLPFLSDLGRRGPVTHYVGDFGISHP